MQNNGRMDLIGGGDCVSMNVEKLTAEEKASAVRQFNESTKNAQDAFVKNIEKELQHSREIKEEAQNLEIMPTNGYILVRLYDKNPYEQIKLTESGIIIPAYDGMVKSQETGEMEKEQLAVRYAEVMEIGPEVKYVQPGDDIIFKNFTQMPAPFLGQDFWIVGQNNVFVVINEKLKERFSKITM